jgi:hypothetical protein
LRKLRSKSVFQSDFHEDYVNVITNLRISRYGGVISFLGVHSKQLKGSIKS